MERNIAINMILEVLACADYDLAKQYAKTSAEVPEEVDDNLQELLEVVGQFIEIVE